MFRHGHGQAGAGGGRRGGRIAARRRQPRPAARPSLWTEGPLRHQGNHRPAGAPSRTEIESRPRTRPLCASCARPAPCFWAKRPSGRWLITTSGMAAGRAIPGTSMKARADQAPDPLPPPPRVYAPFRSAPRRWDRSPRPASVAARPDCDRPSAACRARGAWRSVGRSTK